MSELVEVNKTNDLAIEREHIGLNQLMQMATTLSKSTIVPMNYQNRPENCLIALDMATRMGVSPMMVMQNLYVVQGKPSWSGTAIASMIRNCGSFTDVEVNYVGQENSDSWGCYISAKNKKNGKEINGGTVTIAIAKAEGWYAKTGSKWKTMPAQMLAYRAYSWFGRVHAPELMMGLQSTDEVEDVVTNGQSTVSNPYESR